MLRTRLRAIAALGSAFLLLTLGVHLRLLESLDRGVARSLSAVDLDLRPLQPALVGLTLVAEVGTSLLVVGVLTLVLWVRRHEARSLVPLLLLVAIAVEVLFKLFVRQPETATVLGYVYHEVPYTVASAFPAAAARPSASSRASPTGHAANPALPVSLPHPANAYPSGHAARLTFLAGLLLLYVPLRGSLLARRALQIVVAIAVGLSSALRFYAGEHWLSDVVGGILLGALLAAIAATVFHLHGSGADELPLPSPVDLRIGSHE